MDAVDIVVVADGDYTFVVDGDVDFVAFAVYM